MSLTITAIRKPWSGDCRMCLSKVVLPLPYCCQHMATCISLSRTRNPERTVTGSGFRSLVFVFVFISAPPVFLRFAGGIGNLYSRFKFREYSETL
jgi:hypothetical protein